MDISIQASAPDFFQITERLLGHTLKEQLQEDSASLKNILEANKINMVKS